MNTFGKKEIDAPWKIAEPFFLILIFVGCRSDPLYMLSQRYEEMVSVSHENNIEIGFSNTLTIKHNHIKAFFDREMPRLINPHPERCIGVYIFDGDYYISFKVEDSLYIMNFDNHGDFRKEWVLTQYLDYEPDFLGDSMALIRGMGCCAIFNLKSGISMENSFPFDARAIPWFSFCDEMICLVGFPEYEERKEEYKVVSCYDIYSLDPLYEFASYKYDLYHFYNEKIRNYAQKPAIFEMVKPDVVCGIFGYLPYFFSYDCKNNIEKIWKIPIEAFKTHNCVKFYEKKFDKLIECMKNCAWSVNYYFASISPDTFLVFREYNPPHYIDIIYTKNGEPIYLGSCKVPGRKYPVASDGKSIYAMQPTKQKDGIEITLFVLNIRKK